MKNFIKIFTLGIFLFGSLFFNVNISQAATPPTLGATTASPILPTSVTFTSSVTSLNGSSLIERGTCYGLLTQGPMNNCLGDGVSFPGIGTFSQTRTGLTPSTAYIGISYATNSIGRTYGTPVSFTTPASGALPTIGSLSVSGQTSTTATFSANITSAGSPATILDRGFCAGVSTSPTSCISAGGTFTGSFSGTRSGMSCSHSYYYRAYATNATGTIYTSDGTFSTGACASCTGTPWGTMASGAWNTAYQSSSPTGACNSEARQCTNGTLSGSYTATSCTAGCTGTPWGAVASGYSNTAYNSTSADVCSSQSRVCTAGTLSGSYTATSCTVNSYSITFNSNGGSAVSTITQKYGTAISTPTNPTRAGYNFAGWSPSLASTMPSGGQSLTATWNAAITTPTISTTSPVTSITQTTATGGGNVTSNGGAAVNTSGLVWLFSPSTPDISTYIGKTTTGWALGGPWASGITGLSCGGTYNVRAYATNSAGTSYGSNVSFTTSPCAVNCVGSWGVCSNNSQTYAITTPAANGGTSCPYTNGATQTCGTAGVCSASHYSCSTGTSVSNLDNSTTWTWICNGLNGGSNSSTCTENKSAPTVTTTSPVTSITQTTATGGGNVTSNGGATVNTSGLVWLFSPSTPDISTYIGKTTTGWALGGPWASGITGLSCGGTYNVRAYATNSAGTSYGSNVSFTTPLCTSAPSISSQVSSSITYNSATLGATITLAGNPAFTSRGVCYRAYGDPSYNAPGATCVSVAGTTTGAFTTTISGLSPSSSYNFVGYAGNSIGLVQTGQSTFTTAALPTYSLTVGTAGTGTGIAGPSGSYSLGSVKTLTESPNAGSTFISWIGDSDCLDGIVTMDTNKICAANFNDNSVISIGGSITVTVNQMIGTLLPATSTCTIATTGSSCTVPLTWTTTYPILTSSVTNNDTSTTTPATGSGNNSYSNFVVPYNTSFAGVTSFYLYNNQVLLATSTVTASCDTANGYSWGVSVSRCVLGSFNITASSGTGGTVTPTGVTSKSFGSSQIYTIAPSGNNYAIASVLVDGSSVGAVSTYTFSNIQTSHTISATFNKMIGTLLPATSTCTIATTGSSCTVPLTWTTTYPILTSSVTNNDTSTTTPATGSGNNSYSNFVVPYNTSFAGVTSFYLYNNQVLLATSTVTASCDTANRYSWGGSNCVKAVDGICSGAHYICNAGTSASNSDNASNYTWACNGLNNGTNAPSCSETKPAPTASLSVSATNVAFGSRPRLTWSSTNATSCTTSANWSTGGNYNSSGLTDPITGTSTFTLQCTGNGQTTPLRSVTVTVNAIPSPAITASSCNSSGTSATVSWTDPAGWNNFYTRATNGGVSIGYPGWDDGHVGTTVTFPTIPGSSYSFWVHTRYPADASYYSSPTYAWIDCGIPASVTAWSACSNGSQSRTCTEATLGTTPNCLGLGATAGVNTQTCGTASVWSGYGACSNGTKSGICTEASGGGSPTCATRGYTAGTNSTACGTTAYCSATHYNCSPGTSVNNVSGTSTWTWGCNSADGGVNAPSCSETKPAPTAWITATPSSVTYGNQSNLSWGSLNATTCTAVAGPWSNLTPPVGNSLNGSGSTNPLYASTTFSIQCTGNGQTSAIASVTVGVGTLNGSCGSSNGMSFYVSPTSGYCNAGTYSGISGTGPWSWTCAGANGGTTASCSANKAVDCVGSWNACSNGSQTYHISINASNGGLSCSPYTDNQTRSCGTTASCSATHYLCSPGSTSVNNVSGTSTWTWGCNSADGGVNAPSCSEAKPAPTAWIIATPSSVAYNGQSTLTWGSTNATSCTATGPWSNSGTLSGSGLTNALTANTTFSIQCTGNGQTSTLQSVTVGVGSFNGSCGSSNGMSFYVSPTSGYCNAGTYSGISGTGPWSWTCAGANGGTTASCSANKAVDCVGSWNACSNGSQTYHISINASNGGLSCSPYTDNQTRSCGTTASCSATHYLCSPGSTSVNNVSGTSTWTWGCNSADGGGNAPSCSEAKNFALTINKAGTGAGNVTGAGTYNYGQVITATASPSTGSTFAGWSGDCNGSGQVTMTTNKTCTATFTVVTVGVTASPTTYNTTPNTNVSFTYTPTTNYGATQCRLLNFDKTLEVKPYQANSPIVYAPPSSAGAYGYYVQCRNTVYTTVTATSVLITVTVVTVSVTASTPYNVTPNSSVNFTYTPNTNSGTTECLLQDNSFADKTGYQLSSPIIYTIPNNIGSYGYYVKCRNTTTTTAMANSGLITVNTACANGLPGTSWNGSACVAPGGTLTASDCKISAGKSSCNSNVSWTINNPVAIPTAITASGMTDENVTNTLATPQSGIKSLPVPYPSRKFYLYNNGEPSRADDTASATCTDTPIPTFWDGSKCVTPDGTLSVSPCTVQAGNSCDTATLDWSITNPIGNSRVESSYGPTPIVSLTSNTLGQATFSLEAYKEKTISLYSGIFKAKEIKTTAICWDKTTWNPTTKICELNAPKIDSFTPEPSTIFEGRSSTLSWVADPDLVTSCEVNTVDGTFVYSSNKSTDSHVVTPTETTEYTLTCGRSGYSPATKSATIKVIVLTIKEQ